MKGYMYILKCANGSYYTGSTIDLERRLEQHKNGEGANFTKKHLPVELIYAEEFARIEDAFYREKQIQGWSRKKKEALIAGNFDKLHELAECKNDTKASAPTPFDFAQRTAQQPCFDSAQQPACSLSGAEPRSVSGVEPTMKTEN